MNPYLGRYTAFDPYNHSSGDAECSQRANLPLKEESRPTMPQITRHAALKYRRREATEGNAGLAWTTTPDMSDKLLSGFLRVGRRAGAGKDSQL